MTFSIRVKLFDCVCWFGNVEGHEIFERVLVFGDVKIIDVWFEMLKERKIFERVFALGDVKMNDV